MTTTPCTICTKPTEQVGLCARCHNGLHKKLDDILEFWQLAHDELLPGRSGSGGRSSERTIGLNVNALSFIAGHDILGCLHEWEKLIREARELTPPALVAKAKSLEDEITQGVKFAQANLAWSGTQDWIADFAGEVKDIHSQGMQAAKQFVEKTRRIPCPATMPDGQYCEKPLKVDSDDPLKLFECRKCGTTWSTIRLIAVAMSNPQQPVWLDAEAIGTYLGMTYKNVHEFARRHKIARRGELFDLQQIIRLRNRT